MSNKLSKKGSQNAPQTPKQQVTFQKTQFYQGIIPSADELTRYNEIQPGFADRIIQLTEGEAKHRRSLDKKVVSWSIFTTILGQIFAFGAVGLVVYLCYYAFSLGYANQGSTIACAVLVGIATVFLYNRRKSE